MSWQFVYCPVCGQHQEKVGRAVENMFCTGCCTAWIEPSKKKKQKKK